MKLCWIDPLTGTTGAGYGYSAHSMRMKEALTAAGVTLCGNPDEPCDLVVEIAPPDLCYQYRDKRTIFLTMNEWAPLAPEYRNDQLKVATAIVVPCQFCKREFGKHYRTTPIEVCQEGMVPERFPFYQRSAPAPGEPFTFLFVGSADKRKGSKLVAQAWHQWERSGKRPSNTRLYFKTTFGKGSEQVRRAAPDMVIDSRNLSAEELAALYRSAHAFILPSYCEGWGLTLTEAMATGAPCIWTDYSGPRDFADASIGYPVSKYRMVQNPNHNKYAEFGAEADLGAIVKQMERIYHEYDGALKLGKKASERMHSRYTWAHAAERFIEICQKYV